MTPHGHFDMFRATNTSPAPSGFRLQCAVALTSSPQMYLLTVGIASSLGQFRILWNDLMTGAAVATVPIILS